MKKQMTAFIAAIFITLCIALGIFAVSGVAFANSNGVQASNAPSQSASTTASQGASTDVNASNVVSQVQVQQQQQIQQLQSLVAQYQQRDQQYQQREQQFSNSAQPGQYAGRTGSTTIAAVSSAGGALQQRGIITISSDGQVYINR